MILRFIKFGIVGFVGMCLDFGLTYFLKEKMKCNRFLANALGFTTAVIINYLLNRIWTFQSLDPKVMRQLFSFSGISLLGLLLNIGILYYLHKQRRYNFYASKLLAILAVCCWNFLANDLITFNQ